MPANKLLVAALAALVSLTIFAAAALAHPMGNFSINHYAHITVCGDRIELRYIIDMAEIPTFQVIEETGIVPRPANPTVVAYLRRQAEILARGLSIRLNSKPLALNVISRAVLFPTGAGGLPTMKLGFDYRALVPIKPAAAQLVLQYSDQNFQERAGWKEVIVTRGDGTDVAQSSAPTADRSEELSNYPTDLLHSPPQTLEARVVYRVAAVQSHPAEPNQASAAARTRWFSSFNSLRLGANRQGTPRSALTELITDSRQPSLWFALIAAIVAAGLGAFHALEPGHGKTLVAAYLVGSRGSARHAFLLGATVTTSHTASVYALGGLTIYACRWVVPERLYPITGIASGIIVAGLGAMLFVRRYRNDHNHDHDHDGRSHSHNWLGEHAHGHQGSHEHGHQHSRIYAYHSHGGVRHSDVPDHEHDHGHAANARSISLGGLFALGITGGIVPCPAALVVLLSAISMHRVGFGLFLIVAFSAGLAATLISFGLAMVYARRLMARFDTRGPMLQRWLPLASSAAIILIGIGLVAQAMASSGLLALKL